MSINIICMWTFQFYVVLLLRFCDCGYSRPVHTDAAIDRESDQSEVSTRTLRTDAFGKLTFVEDEDEDLDWKTKPNNIQVL